MRANQLESSRKWFKSYIRKFAPNNGRLPALLHLKKLHSERVAREASALAFELGWQAGWRNAAEALGLLHDIGRFPQFARYGTFADAISVDHGEYGWQIAREAEPLLRLPRTEREWILTGIRYHNRRAVPDFIGSQSRLFLNLIRDADKLDIFRIALQYVELDGFRDLPRMLPNITLDRKPGAGIVRELLEQRSCSYHKVKSLGDFFVMQLSWIYDLCYRATCRRVLARKIIPRVIRQIDGNSQIKELGAHLSQWLRRRQEAPVESEKTRSRPARKRRQAKRTRT